MLITYTKNIFAFEDPENDEDDEDGSDFGC